MITMQDVRVLTHFKIEPMDKEEVRGYVAHQMKLAGAGAELTDHPRGVPRGL